ncbi:MAG: hypothetical protein FMNOHCHN_02998 [Ignavibacteriaceae bacterium]|nr:hypothetical protein [Ignavibacteriaceae bacterium]
MIYKKLHKTIEDVTSKAFESEEKMITSVIDEFVHDKIQEIIGGRLWKLFPDEGCYRIVYQTGKMGLIKKNFEIKVSDYSFMDLFVNERTIFGHETNHELMKKGIFKFAASGVGDRIKISGKYYYEYLVAYNRSVLNEEFKYLLNIMASVLTSKIRLRRSSKSAKTLMEDLDKARQLQRSILPQHEYVFFDYDIYGLTVPAEMVGGDFFDYLESKGEKDRIGIILGDAASKGVSAAAEAMYISGALRMASTFEIKIAPLMKRMNALVNQIFSDDKFTSLFYGELSNDKTGLFLFASAGHNPSFFLKKGAKDVILLNPTGPVLGPSPKASYTVENVNFNPGDILLIYSDGVVESQNADGEFYEESRLKNMLIRNSNKSAREIALKIIEDVIKFSKNGQYNDDKTLVIIKKRG